MAERVAAVRARITEATAASARNPGDITLVAVSKTFAADVIVEAADAGLTDFGENRAQELKQKVGVVSRPVRWHFVGHLQTNKARHVIGSVVLVHSVDRFGLAEEIARRARVAGITQDVLIEVNVSGEVSKHGVEPAGVGTLADSVASLEGIALKGLMTIPPRTPDPGKSRP